MKSKAKPVKGSARAKRFDRGGTVGALAGLGTLAFLLNREKNKQKAAADAPDVAKTLTARSTMGEDVSSKQVEDERFVGAEKGDVTAKSDTGSTTPIKKTEKYDPNAGQDRTPVQGVDEKTLDRLQRRNVPSGGKKKPATSSAQGSVSTTGVDAGIAAGRAKPKPTPDMGKENKDRPSKPYPEKQARDNKVMKGGTSLLSEESSKQANKAVGNAWRAQNPNLIKSQDEKYKDYQKRNADYQKMLEGFKNKKSGGTVKKYASGGSVSSASKRADGIAIRGKTRA